MSSSEGARPATGSVPSSVGASAPIQAVKLRHPWRIVFSVVLVVALVVFAVDAAGRKAFGWEYVAKYLFDRRISAAALVTLELTVLAMIIGIVLGLVLAVMRLSPNPVVKYVAWLYLWVFRGTPVYVQLVFWGLLTLIYPTLFIGVQWLHIGFEGGSLAFLQNVFFLAVIGLGLNESAYMAEIVRAGLLSVDKGQEEAATALGMSWGQTMWRIVIPQSMRVIIPPTGNDVISMLKTTSLVAAIPLTIDLYGVSRDISAVTYTPIPLLIVASLWYLAVTSVLMVGQFYLERYFSRGVSGSQAKQKKGPGNPGPITEAVTAMRSDEGGAA